MSPRARVGLRLLGYAALALVAFVFALHLTFPYGRVKDKIEEALSAKYDVTIGGVERSIVPGRFSLTAVTLRSRPSVPNEPPTTMFFKSITVDIAFLPLLAQKIAVGLDLATAQGTMTGDIRVGKSSLAIDFRLKNVPLATIPGIADAVGLPLFGNADGEFKLELPSNDWSRAKGKFDLSCTVGCVVGDGVTKIYPKARREQDQAFVKDGTVVPEIKITRFALGIDVEKGEAKKRKFELVSPDGEAEIDFDIKLAKNIRDSVIEGCISYKCSEALKTRVPKFAASCDFSSPAIDEKGFHDIKLTGKLTAMRRLGTTCDTTGADATGGNGDGDRSRRPTLDSTTVHPVDSIPPPMPPPPPTPQPTPPPVEVHAPEPGAMPPEPPPMPPPPMPEGMPPPQYVPPPAEGAGSAYPGPGSGSAYAPPGAGGGSLPPGSLPPGAAVGPDDPNAANVVK